MSEPILRKTQPPQDEEGNHWSSDRLDRKKFADQLTRLVESTNQPFVIGIEAPYGSGKSYFLSRWRKDLLLKEHTAIYIDAWATDFSDSPLVAFVAEFEHTLKKTSDTTLKKRVSDLSKAAGVHLYQKGLPVALRIATSGLFDFADLKKLVGDNLTNSVSAQSAELVEAIAREEIAQHSKAVNSIKEFRNKLSELVNRSREEISQDHKFVVIIDELDRCRPDYAIEMLECIKHFFSVEGLVFVIAYDKTHLAGCIASVYSEKLDTDAYLRKFIDWRTTLPSQKGADFVLHTCRQLSMQEVIHHERDFSNFIEFCSTGAIAENTSLRSLEQEISNISLSLRVLNIRQPHLGDVFGVYCFLRVSENGNFEKLANAEISAEHFLRYFDNKTENLKEDHFGTLKFMRQIIFALTQNDFDRDPTLSATLSKELASTSDQRSDEIEKMLEMENDAREYRMFLERAFRKTVDPQTQTWLAAIQNSFQTSLHQTR
ncbi:conserved protein [Tepidicaulis marinus]|uniref:Conserved protein n=1 Tax=Tepidicaulis marinus TaxID=1333998 RepID=A0A081B8V4_9HYPH|nr:P-loop NTPase fold protein [Tepidicaulis marinus]GAK44472.1 conserved protein [Tepidicaulis marinus]